MTIRRLRVKWLLLLKQLMGRLMINEKTWQKISQAEGVTAILLLNNATAPDSSEWALLGRSDSTIQVTLTGTGAVTASVDIEVSDDQVGVLTAFTISLAGTTLISDGSFIIPKWLYVRASLTAITGTNAAVTVTAGA